MMPRFVITETAEYIIDAADEDQALELFLAHSPSGGTGPVQFVAVTDRVIEPAASVTR